MTAQSLSQGLAHLGACLSLQDKKSYVTVTFPEDTWWRLRGEVLLAMEAQAGGGIVTHWKPPEGEAWANGFWYEGCWVKYV